MGTLNGQIKKYEQAIQASAEDLEIVEYIKQNHMDVYTKIKIKKAQ
jgi:hypothetical protein